MSSTVPSGHTSWVVNPYPWRESQSLADTLGLPLVAAMVLAGRGLRDPVAARMFLECTAPFPDPFLFKDMEGAVTAISEAIEQRRRIVVHGDYDADGITATALILLGLREFGVEAEWYLPNRFNEGYGLSRRAVETIAGEGPALLLTVDCGVNYPDEVALAREMGLDVVVIDHHQPGARLPECHLIHQVAGGYPHGDLCGVGLGLKVMHALHMRRRGARPDVLPEQLDRLLDLAAIGTIADLAPLVGENRYYVKEGLKLIGIGQRVGLRALATVAGCTGVADSGAVAYRLAPRLNAAGRLADPSVPLRLLLTEDEEEARALAARLHELNSTRQDVERRILEEATARVEALAELPRAIVLAGADWHEGVVGIVASRLVERYHRPTILLGIREGMAKGSGRSIPAYDLFAGVSACARMLTIYGGHAQAVGLTLDADRVDDFCAAITEHAGQVLTPADLVPSYQADAVLRGEDIDADTALALASLGPFGSGNQRPDLLLIDVAIANAEATRNGAHLRCEVEVDGVRTRGIGFGMGGAAAMLREDARRRLAGVELRVDEWRGVLRPELVLERIALNEEGAAGLCGECGECSAGCASGTPSEAVTAGAASRRSTSAAATTMCAPAARDLRDRRGRLSALAQVLATREPVIVLTCSVPHTLPVLGERIPMRALSGGEVECVGRGCLRPQHGWGGNDAHVAVVEWDVAERVALCAAEQVHLVAIDPPFRTGHVALLDRAAELGAAVHLYYGEDERRATARLLRYLVHPRFAMVCLYRAMQEEAGEQATMFSRAVEIAWQEARVVLTHSDLVRAQGVLTELGGERLLSGEVKLAAKKVPAYAAAEAEYEECLRLCLTL